MIYLKINNKVYDNDNLKDFIADYPIETVKKYLALHRIIFNTLRHDLKDYPDIDVIISDKKQNSVLGRFCVNFLVKHKEYRFIPGNNPYIILFAEHILKYNYRHKIKGFKETFLHEFYHFRQWLLKEKLSLSNRDIPGKIKGIRKYILFVIYHEIAHYQLKHHENFNEFCQAKSIAEYNCDFFAYEKIQQGQKEFNF